jgi:hypothetical protein
VLGCRGSLDRPSPGLRTHQLAVAADAVTVVEQFDRRSLRARRQTGGTDRLERESEASGGRQSLLQVQRKAISRNHIEADAWEQHDAAGLRLSVPRLNGLVDRDLAGDVEIVGVGAQATFDQRLGGAFEWPGAVQHDRSADLLVQTALASRAGQLNTDEISAYHGQPIRIGGRTLVGGDAPPQFPRLLLRPRPPMVNFELTGN